MEQSRFKSPVVWAAIGAQVVAILLLVGAIGEGMGDAIRAVMGGVLEVLVLIGILNDPTDRLRF